MPKNQLPENTILDCLNCGSKINTSDSYCQSCGQKIKSYRLSLWKLLREVFASIFNLESKFVKTTLNVWNPVFLTKAYVAGERKKYYNPGRLFIVSFFILSALLSIFLKSHNFSSFNSDNGQELYRSTFKEEMLSSFDSLRTIYPTTPERNMDSIRYEMFSSEKILELDSINSPPAIVQYGTSMENQGGLIDGESDFKIATKDIKTLSKEELFEKYKIKKFYRQVLFLQYIKFKENPNSWSIFMVTNSLWTIIISTFFLALFMKLLYIRNKYYYVEHVVFLMLFQSLLFLACIACILISSFNVELAKVFLGIVFTVGSIYFIVCLKLYYKQGLIKTLLKSFLISMIHVILLSICLLIVGGVSFLLY